MKKPTSLALGACIVLTLSACWPRPDWHWEKTGSSDDDYTRDVNACKARTYNGADGNVTQELVNRMHACLEQKGWRKVKNGER